MGAGRKRQRVQSRHLKIVGRDPQARIVGVLHDCWVAATAAEAVEVSFQTCDDFVRKYGLESWDSTSASAATAPDLTFVADLDGLLEACGNDPEVAATALTYAQIDAPESEVTPSAAELLWTHAHNSSTAQPADSPAAAAVVFRGRLTSPVAVVQWSSDPDKNPTWQVVRSSPVGRHGSPWTVYAFNGSHVTADLGTAANLVSGSEDAMERLRQCLCTRFERQ